MIFLIILILLFSLIYLAVFILAHQDANMIKPLTYMTGFMIFLLVATALVLLAFHYWYISVIIAFVAIGLTNFLIYLLKY